MHNLLKIIKLPSIINNDIERSTLINKLIQVTVEKLDVACATEDHYVLAIHALMKIKLNVMINQVRKKWTRSDSKNYDHMCMMLHERIKKRKNNKCLQFYFKEDCSRSKNELIHLLSEHY